MKAVVLTAFGPPEVLQLRDVPTPVAASGDLLIRVHATSVNSGDTLVRNFAAVSPRTSPMPWLFWLVGRLSFGVRAPRMGAHAEYLSVRGRASDCRRPSAARGLRG